MVVLALDRNGATMSQGSGVVVGKKEVVTNCHVVEKAAAVTVRQASGQAGGESWRMTASLLARHDKRDLCLLFVDELSEPPAASVVRLGSARELSMGEEVYAIGAPAGLELSLSRGIVSQLRGVFGKRSAPVVQTDAAISPGSSGGGLFNGDGELVGITTFKWKGENLNFALPAEWVLELREQGSLKSAAVKRRSSCLESPDFDCVISLALNDAYGIDIALLRGFALREIATAQAKAGDIAAAFKTSRSINHASTRASALGTIAAEQAKAGQRQKAGQTFAAALDTARSINIALLRGFALRDIATAQAKAGDIAAAFKTSRSINHASTRAWALGTIAAEQAKAKDFKSAMKTAMSIKRTSARASALASVALHLARRQMR